MLNEVTESQGKLTAVADKTGVCDLFEWFIKVRTEDAVISTAGVVSIVSTTAFARSIPPLLPLVKTSETTTLELVIR